MDILKGCVPISEVQRWIFLRGVSQLVRLEGCNKCMQWIWLGSYHVTFSFL